MARWIDDSTVGVLDDGFVRLDDLMGSDESVCKAARVSTGSVARSDIDNARLIKYLTYHEHTSPFEFVQLIFHVRLPIFVARQWIRHRTGSYNEMSGRYRELDFKVYMPDAWRMQGTGRDKQQSGDLIHPAIEEGLNEGYRDAMAMVSTEYEALLENGVAREMARLPLPVAQYTEFYFRIDFHNLRKFLYLRNDEHAQQEIREYAQAIETIMGHLTQLRWSWHWYHRYRGMRKLFDTALEELGEDQLRDLLALEIGRKKRVVVDGKK